MMMPLYLLPRFASRRTNFKASSCTHLIPLRLFNCMFWLAQFNPGRDASQWVTSAPAAVATTDAAPVYAKRFNTRDDFFHLLTELKIKFQFSPCSGKIPT